MQGQAIVTCRYSEVYDDVTLFTKNLQSTDMK